MSGVSLGLYELIAARDRPTDKMMADGASEEESAAGGEDLLMEISNILNTGLDRASLSILVEMLQQGVHPEALARVVLELDKALMDVKKKEETKALALQMPQTHREP